MSNPIISIIVPFYGCKSDIKKCLDSLCIQKFSYPYEIIIVESGNSSYVKSMISNLSNVRLICSEIILTPGKARNLAVKSARSSLLAFTDADCAVDPDWLSELYNSLQQHQIVIGPVLNLFPLHPIASVDNLLQFVDFQKYGSMKVNHFPACNLGIRKDLFQSVSGFPESLFTGEDVVFSESAIALSNGSVHYNKKMLIRHSGRKKLSQLIKHNSLLGFYRGYYNLKIIYKRHSERNLLLFSLYYGLRRLSYITIKTIQWNPAGIIRFILFFPLVLLGLAAWTEGFFQGNKEYYVSKTTSINNSATFVNE